MSKEQRNIREYIIIKGAREHNLKNLDLKLPKRKLIVVTGVSGSGKSSLVFDTLYAEGQRRYVENLSSYARQFLERINKPDVDAIHGIMPAVAIEQKKARRNPRSTVGTSTEIYDYLRLLYARIGKTYCFNCGNEVKKDSVSTVVQWLENQKENSKFLLTFPYHQHEDSPAAYSKDYLIRKGFFRIFLDGEIINLNKEEAELPADFGKLFVVIDRIKIQKGKTRERYSDSIETCFKEGEGRLAVINPETNVVKNFSRFYECCGIKYAEPEPRFFSFNNPYGACPVCEGFGKTIGYDLDLVIPNKNLSLSEGAIAPWRTFAYSDYLVELVQLSKRKGIPLNVPFKELKEEQKDLIINGDSKFPGIAGFFKELERKTYKMHIRVLLSKYRGYTTCAACKGSRLRREALQVKINFHSIYDVVQMTIEKAADFFNNLKLSEYDLKVGGMILNEIRKRLKFLNEVGLGYLTLDRLSNTLSGGEAQRINLATSLGSALRSTLYVLDEPTIGLHPRDNGKLINILKSLRDLGNTVVVVEHDADMMKNSDLIIDLGPGAGASGGNIVAQSSYKDLLQNNNSLTGKYLSGQKKIPMPHSRNKSRTNSIIVKKASENNLKNITVEFPLNKFVVVTGVSGSGKSSLVEDVLYKGLKRKLGENIGIPGRMEDIEGAKFIRSVKMVDQSPIGKSPRSNPISYLGGYEEIRKLFAATPLARSRNYKPGYFSFNIPGGRCETCEGQGFVKIEMQFLADIYLQCEDCRGTRFKPEVREITYRGKNIVEVLELSVNRALKFFTGEKKMLKYLQALSDVGLDYIKLGQPSNTLSGGEAQRVKLASELLDSKRTKGILYIFDEPTTGLHFEDINKLLKAFHQLIKYGNSLIIIEHNLDVIKNADYVIDLGPEAGEKGGDVIFAGTPEDLMKCEKSYTGKYLKEYLNSVK